MAQWPPCSRFKDEKEVKKSKTVDVESKSDGTQILTVKSSTTQDSGEYRCEATNKTGTTSTKATVTVNGKPLSSCEWPALFTDESASLAAAEPMEVEEPKPKEEKPKFDQQLTSQTVEEGDKVTFQVTVSGQPRPTVKFYKDGKEVKEDKTHTITEESEGVWKLTIQKTTTTDVGQYKAEATNAAGKVSTEASLSLKGKMVFLYYSRPTPP